jgi:DNA repair exonuclease SbcCD ATPase subunit
MIHFHSVQWKNFLSTGNAFTRIVLDAHPTTLVVGENGSGKSTMLDAICFGLFGKPYRNINKPQLVNTINNKNCVVEIEFTIGPKQYKVIRGIKPSIFEIWANGELINQDAASRDYQKYLEEYILKLNFKSFTQIVILGSATFTPFMQLPAASRREVIEDILDIKIFTAMNQVLKEKNTELKTKLQEVEGKISVAKSKAQLQQDYIQTLMDDREARIADLQHKIRESNNEISQKQIVLNDLDSRRNDYFSTIRDSHNVEKDLKEVLVAIDGIETSAEKIEKEIAFFHRADVCPKCKQGIPHDFKEDIVKESKNELNIIETKRKEIQEKEQVLKARIAEINATNTQISSLTDEITEIKNDIATIERYIQRLELEKAEVSKKVGNIEVEKAKLKDLAKDTMNVIKERSDIHELNTYYDIAAVLLKDSGIKTRIIKQYVPVINKLVNKFLAAMDFFVQFTLNEKFEESIKSRHRDDFSYESFSEGEKQRIDLALVFTWRTIAKLKNSASTNLLILDEVFDSSLDNTATEHVMTLLNALGEGTNVWVISHKGDQLFDKFTRVVKFAKKQNFSVVVS